MNNRTLALLALSYLVSGCTPIAVTPTVTSDSAPAGSADQSVEIPAQENSVSDVMDIVDDSSVTIENENLEGLTGTSLVESESSSDALSAEQLRLSKLEAEQRSVLALCEEIGNKLGSVTVDDCLNQSLSFGGGYTVQSRPIVVKDVLPEVSADTTKKNPRILIMGGLHGDEYSSISIMFRWMEQLESSNNRDFEWRFAPTVNPDGLLDGQAARQNANGVDLNRNFPSDDWTDLAQDYWMNTTNRNPRRYPGSHPASEPEVQWVVDQINTFKPDVIVSVHAPYHLLDYDGPPEPPEKIGELHLHLLGVYPGSLGNYAGLNLGIPVVTMELPSAGIMPADDQITKMWNDLLAWLYEHHES